MTITANHQITSTASAQTPSLLNTIKQNFNERKWEILIPGPVGLAALAATVVFLLSNPFGWAISTGLLAAGIACASVNAILALGHSLSILLKEPKKLNNLITDETVKENISLPAEQKAVQFESREHSQVQADTVVGSSSSSEQEQTKQIFDTGEAVEVRKPTEALAPLVKEQSSASTKGRISSLFQTIWTNRLKIALTAGLVGVGIYSFYNYPSISLFISSFFSKNDGNRANATKGKNLTSSVVNKMQQMTRLGREKETSFYQAAFPTCLKKAEPVLNFCPNKRLFCKVSHGSEFLTAAAAKVCAPQ